MSTVIGGVPVTAGLDCMVDREAFVEALAMAESAVDARPLKHAQRFARLVVLPQSRELQIFGSDASVTIDVGDVIRVSGMNREGSALIPVQKLRALLADVSDDEVWLYTTSGYHETKGGELNVKWNGGRCTVPVPGTNELPVPDSFDDCWDFYAIDPHDLAAGIEATLPVIEVNHHATAAMGGVYVTFDPDAKTMDFCGTDGRQMAVYTVSDVDVTNKPAGVGSLNRRGADLLCRLIRWACPDLRTKYEPVFMALSNESVLFKVQGAAGTYTLKSRLNEGRFPKYKAVLAMVDDSYQQAEVQIQDWITALRQAAVCLDGESCGVTIRMEPGQSVMQASTPEIGSAWIKVSLLRALDVPVSVTVDLRLFLRSLQSMTKGLKCELSIRDDRSMIRLRNDAYVYTIMPIVTPT